MKRNKLLNLALILGLLITLLVFIGGCYYPTTTEGEEGTSTGTDWWTIAIFLVLIVAIFYFLMIRPQRKRAKEQQKLMEGLQKGDKVVTAGGIYGVIDSVSEDSVVIKVESGATVRVAKTMVAVKREQ